MKNDRLPFTSLNELIHQLTRTWYVMRPVQLYQIRDLVGQSVVGPIITAHHPAAAVRHFTDLLADKNTMLASHPEDYELLHLGEQDETTGDITSMRPNVVLTGVQWKQIQDSRDTRDSTGQGTP